MATITRKRVTPVANAADGAWQIPAGAQVQAVTPPWDEPAPDEQTDTDRVMELMRSASGAANASVKVYKIENGISSFCDSYQPAEFEAGDYSMLRDAFGAGKYKIMLYGTHPVTSNFGLLARENVTLMESRAPKVVENRVDNAMAQVLQSLVDNQRATNEAIMALKNTPPVDQMAQMTQMLSLMTMMRTAMGVDNQPKSVSGISEIVAAVRELRGVANEIIPERGDAEPSLMSMMPQALELMKTAMQQPAQPAQQMQPMQPQLIQIPRAMESAQPTQTPQPQNTPEDEMKLNEIMALKKNLAELLNMAKSGASTTEGANVVYDKLPDDFVEMLADDKWLDMLSLIDTECKTQTIWLTNVRNEALAMFDAPEESEPLPTAQS